MKLDGAVAFVTGAARGQGRAHAVRLAHDGANVVALDVCEDIETVPYPLATRADLDDTVSIVEKAGGHCIAVQADVRDCDALAAAVATALEAYGRIDILVANAGIWSRSDETWTMSEQTWQTMIDVNLTGQWKAARAVIPAMIAGNRGGSIVFTSSTLGLMGTTGDAHYTAAKHGVIGLMRTLAHELGARGIRVNAVCPTSVRTEMITNQAMYKVFRPDLESPSFDDCRTGFKELNIIPVAAIDATDVSNAVSWLVSDEARYVTGVALPVDAGSIAK